MSNGTVQGLSEADWSINQEIEFQLAGFYLSLLQYAEDNEISYETVAVALNTYGISGKDFLFEVEEWNS